jgi:hypothetical protein
LIGYKIPLSLKENTWQWLQDHSLGHRAKANGNKEEQYTGLLGENMFRTIIGLSPTYEEGFDGGYDIYLYNKKIDVKTMGRSVDPKPHYVNNFISYQEHFDCNIYAFCSINKKENTFWVCGLTDKETMLQNANFYQEGETRYRDNGTSFTMKAPTYEIQNHQLYQVDNIESIWKYIKYYE